MAKKKFQPGDLVQLKSGGPTMTVNDIDYMRESRIECQWFAGKKLESGWFDESGLVPAEEGGKEEK